MTLIKDCIRDRINMSRTSILYVISELTLVIASLLFSCYHVPLAILTGILIIIIRSVCDMTAEISLISPVSYEYLRKKTLLNCFITGISTGLFLLICYVIDRYIYIFAETTYTYEPRLLYVVITYTMICLSAALYSLCITSTDKLPATDLYISKAETKADKIIYSVAFISAICSYFALNCSHNIRSVTSYDISESMLIPYIISLVIQVIALIIKIRKFHLREYSPDLS